MNDPHENPQNDYERSLAMYDLECSQYACWKPMEVLIKHANHYGQVFAIGVCLDHINNAPILMVLET